MKKIEKRDKICVLGMGYIGLPTACFFAKAGFRVVGIDINEGKIKDLRQGVLPFKEKGLPQLFLAARKNMQFSTAVVPADVFIIAVPTPISKDKRANLSYVKKATLAITEVLDEGNLVVLESTVSPRCCLDIIKPILDKSGRKYFLTHCPERAIPGDTLHEMVHDDRIVGGIDERSTKLTAALYRFFVKGNIHETDASTAEVAKVAENTYRDVNIAFANEFARICEGLGVNTWEAIRLANLHPRVNIHSPGPGVGGHCISQDPWFLIESYPSSKIVKQARVLNDSMPAYVVERLNREKGKVRIKKVGVLGVAYKKNVDDSRESPAGHIYTLLGKKGYSVKCTDPYVKKFIRTLHAQKDLLSWADAVILVTDHDAYKKIDFSKYPDIKLVFDTRNLFRGKIKGEAKLITLGVR